MAAADAAGYPVLLKATDGGGGIGIYRCNDAGEVRKQLAAAGRCVSSRALVRQSEQVQQALQAGTGLRF